MINMTYRPVADLNLLEDNPRTISDESFQKLCDSIRKNKAYFEARPIILSDRTGTFVVIAGNQRLKAAIEIGMEEVPTVLIPDLTEAEEKEIIIRDNISNGDFDFDLLKMNWDEEDLNEWGLPTYWDDEEDTEDAEPGIKNSLPKLTIEDSDISRIEKLKDELNGRGFECKITN